MGLGGPNLVKGATGQTIDGETLGGAVTHTEISGVAHYAADDDDACLAKLRDLVAHAADAGVARAQSQARRRTTPRRRAVRPAAGRSSHVVRHASRCSTRSSTTASSTSSRRISRSEMICGDARIDGIPVGVIANQRGLIKGRPGEKPRFGGIVYAESAEKVAFFIDRCDRERIPLLFVQDVSGFMVGPRSRARGNHSRRRALRRSDGDGARAEDRAHGESRVGRRLLRDGGAGLRSRFHLQLADGPHGGDGRRGRGPGGARSGDRSGAQRRSSRSPRDVGESIDEMRADYEHQLDARYAGARGFIDAIVYPEETRDVLALALRASLHNPGPHLGAFVLPAHSRRMSQTAGQNRIVRVAVGAGLLGRLARGAAPAGRGRRRRLPDARLPRRSHDVAFCKSRRSATRTWATRATSSARWRACCRPSPSAACASSPTPAA